MTAFRVIIVEDDPMVTEVNRAYVESVPSFTVVATARTSTEGIRLLNEIRPDLVILDIFLPDLDGVEILREIRRTELPTDVVMLTTAQDAQTIQDVLRQGSVDYIIEPLKLERIRSTLESYAAMRSYLATSSLLSQADLDRLTAHIGARGTPIAASEEPTLPKGVTEWTLRQVVLFLVHQQSAVSATEVGDGIGLARVTVRRYLDYLVQQRRLRVEQLYGPVGRPVYRYLVR